METEANEILKYLLSQEESQFRLYSSCSTYCYSSTLENAIDTMCEVTTSYINRLL